MIADHGIEQLEEILDSHRVIERMADFGRCNGMDHRLDGERLEDRVS